MLRIEVHQTRESCFSESEGPLGNFLYTPCVFSFAFTEESNEFGHTAIKPRSVGCCSDVCPFVHFSYLHIWSWSSTRVTIRFFVTTLTKALLHRLFSLARRPALIRILVVLGQTSSFKGNRTTCFCDPSMKQNFSPKVLPDANLFLSSTDSYFEPRDQLLDSCLSAVGPFIKTCVPFQIIPIQLNLPQVTFTQSPVTPTSNMNAPELNSNCLR